MELRVLMLVDYSLSVCSTMFQEYLTIVFVLPAKVVCDLGPLLHSHSCLWRGKFDSVSGASLFSRISVFHGARVV